MNDHRIVRHRIYAALLWGLVFLAATPHAFAGDRLGAVGQHGWLQADYLLWWTRGLEVPPLLTTSPDGTPLASAGVLGAPGTRTLIGDESYQDDARSGWRLAGGLWLDACQTRAVEMDYLRFGSLGGENIPFGGNDSIFARPFLDASNNQQAAELVSFPGVVDGLGSVQIGSSGLEGWGIGLRQCLAQCGDCCQSERLDLVAGYRRYRLGDSLTIEEHLRSPLFANGTVLSLQDEFAARNTFHGAEIGLVYARRRTNWELSTRAKIAFGATRSEIGIDGQTIITSPGSPTIAHQGGLFALSSNIGTYERDEFTALFETGVDLGYRVTRDMSLQIGYSFLLWPGVYRSPDQIDTTINPALLPPPLSPAPGPARPAATLRDSTFWAQGIRLGLTYRF